MNTNGSYGRSGRHRVLVVDDDPDMVLLVRRTLDSDFDVATAENGQRAMDMVAASLPDLVMLDLDMPVIDGLETCRRLRAAHSTMPIVILTGHTDEESVKSAFGAGATDYVTKPFFPSQLRSRVRSWLMRSN